MGPQKTGTTALHTFLKLHPNVVTSYPSATSYEEIQFFSSTNNYLKGIDWYMDFYPSPSNVSSSDFLVDKSANYFDSELSPRRLHSLLPNARLITLLTPPGLRAYSWYQHQKAHNDPAALKHSFYEIVTATSSPPPSPPSPPSPPPSSAEVLTLRNRCLYPGLYAHHLQAWLRFFPVGQLLILDGTELRRDPAALMSTLQKFLGLTPILDYSTLLKYDVEKGFWCVLLGESGRSRCLGKSKGRTYPDMEPRARRYLERYYAQSNAHLLTVITSLGQKPPHWLTDSLTTHS